MICVKSQDWARSSEAWVEGGTSQPNKKRQRSKAYSWLLAVENILKEYTGKGLAQYLAPQHSHQSAVCPYSWPWLGIALDRGSDSWAAKQFLKYHLHANVEEFPDQSHDVWNDVRGALRATGLWNHVLLMVLALNLSHAPFGDGKWHEILHSAFKEYYRLASHRDPLFQRFWKNILADWNEMHREHEPNIIQNVWDRLPDQWCWSKRGEKVGMCRFFGYITSSGSYQQVFHTKLLVMVYLGITEGWLRKEEMKKAAQKTIKMKDTGADRKQSMKESSKQVSKLFGYGNTMQLITVCKLDPDTHFHQSMVVHCTKPLQQWHAEQNKTLRSCSNAGEWFMKQAAGGFLHPICEAFSILWGLHPEIPLQRLGFEEDVQVAHGNDSSRSGSSSSSDSISQPEISSHPQLLVANQRADRTLYYNLNLACNRIQRTFWCQRGWPAQACLLGSDEPTTRDDTIELLKADRENYMRCKKAAPSVFGNKGLSVFETRAVQQVVGIMKVEHWKDSKRAQEWAKRKYSSLIQTQIIEDGFQRERLKETRSAAKTFNEATAWHTLIKKKVLAKVHKFKTFPMAAARRGVQKKVKQRLYHPSASKTSCDLKAITLGKTTQASWWTCNSSTWNRSFAHLVLQDYCVSDPLWPVRVKSTSKCWLCCLCQTPNMLIRLKGTEQWHFALGTLAEVVGIAWPACEVTDDKGKVVGYLPQKDAPEDPRKLITLCPMTVVWPLEASEYEAMIFQVKSPEDIASSGIHTYRATTHLQPVSQSQSAEPSASSQPAAPSNTKLQLSASSTTDLVSGFILAVPTRTPEPILKSAARRCFNGWKIELLKKLLQHLNIEVLPKDKLIDILKKLLKEILSPLNEEDLLLILALRELKKDPYEELLQQSDVVGACISHPPLT